MTVGYQGDNRLLGRKQVTGETKGYWGDGGLLEGKITITLKMKE
jgi:hypothetical protein